RGAVRPAQRPGRPAAPAQDRQDRLARPGRGARSVPGRVHRNLSQSAPGVRTMTDSTPTTTRPGPVSPVTRAGRLVRAVVLGVLDVVRGLATRAGGFAESWLMDAKHATYGIAVTRMLLGATGIGLLLTNFSTRLYTFGSGVAWSGETAEPVSPLPR